MAGARAILAAAVLALAVTGCTPEIGPGTYFCGPEKLCPPELACDEPTFTCESQTIAQPFMCPAGSQAFEPDDDMGAARSLDDLVCGQAVLGAWTGCVSEGSDADYVTFVNGTSCAGSNPHIAVTLRYPVAFAPLLLEVLDEQGAVIATGELCTLGNDATGTERVCLDLPQEPATYFIRVSADPEAPDCDGECQYNQYTLDISSLLS